MRGTYIQEERKITSRGKNLKLEKQHHKNFKLYANFIFIKKKKQDL